MLHPDQHSDSTTETSRAARRSSRMSDTNGDVNPSKSPGNTSHKLPSGTGIGTSGKAAREMEADRVRQTEQGTAGSGTDTAAAIGGDLGSTHSSARTSGESFPFRLVVGT